MFKAGLHVKAVLTSLNTANISVTFQATLNLYDYFINHCVANFWVIFGHFEKDMVFLLALKEF